MKFDTKAIHAGHKHEKQYGAHTTPIYQTSTFLFENAEQGGRRFSGEEEGYKYTRLGNPNSDEVASKLVALENGEAGCITSTGMSAVSSVLLSLLSAGDHIIAADCLYGCSFNLINTMLPQNGIEIDFIDTLDLDTIEKKFKESTKVLYIETPANPTMKLIDIQLMADIAHKHNAVLVVDNTFMTPYLQRPLEMGADIVIHSMTKYLGGHGDVVAGAIITSKELMATIFPFVKDYGTTGSPFDSWLLMRGMKTLGLRMRKHCENAVKVAEFLENDPRIDKVYYPGLKSFGQYELACKTLPYGFGGMIAFELKGGFVAGKVLMNNLNLIGLAVSLGSVDSLIQHPASMTHGSVPAHEREASGITDGLVRIHVGVEDVEDIIQDLKSGLDKI